MTRAPVFHHRIGRWTVACDRPLPALPTALGATAEAGAPDIRVTAAPLAASDAPAPAGWSVDAAGLRVMLPGIVHLRADRSGGVTVAPEPDVPAALLAEILVQTIVPWLALQRHVVPLRGAIVACAGGAVCLAGRAGAGVSALAAALHGMGLCVLGDAPVLLGAAGVEPTLPELQLSGDVVTLLGLEDGVRRVRRGGDLWRLPLAGTAPGPLPLCGLYLVDAARSSDAGRMVAVRGAARLEAMRAAVALPQLATGAADVALFHAVAERFRAVPIHRFGRAGDLRALRSDAAALAEHFGASAPAAR